MPLPPFTGEVLPARERREGRGPAARSIPRPGAFCVCRDDREVWQGARAPFVCVPPAALRSRFPLKGEETSESAQACGYSPALRGKGYTSDDFASPAAREEVERCVSSETDEGPFAGFALWHPLAALGAEWLLVAGLDDRQHITGLVAAKGVLRFNLDPDRLAVDHKFVRCLTRIACQV